MRRLNRVLPWVVAGAALAVAVFAVVLSALAGEHGDPWWQSALGLCAVLAAVSIGLLITVRRPGHPIGSLLLAEGLLLASVGAADGYAQYAVLEDPGALPGAEWAVLWGQSSWPLLFAVILALVLLFPDGRLPSPRWRGVFIGGTVAIGGFLILSFFDPEPFEAPYEDVGRPLPSLPDALSVLWPVFFLGILGSIFAAVRAVRSRFRRATGIERLQFKWLAYSALLVPLVLLVPVIGGVVAGGVEDGAFTALFLFMLGSIPASVGVAVLRYRLYEIDRLINATLVYGALTVLLGATFAAVTLIVGVAIGGDSTFSTAAATLAVAVAFRPLRDRVQTQVDRRFNRARYEGLQKVHRFLDRLRIGRSGPEEVGSVIADAVSDPSLRLFFWLPSDDIHADASGRVHAELPPVPAGRTPVRRGELLLGTIVHSPELAESPGLLDPVIVKAGLAIEIARLRVEVRRQLAEVEQSRARIVAATYEERRRLERDLHDGAQQRLVSIGLDLRHLQHQLGSGNAEAKGSLDAVVGSLTEAIDELRELARGVRPAALDNGLAAALRELGSRSPIPTEVEATEERFSEDIEAAAYFVASEGLTNAVKHAGGSRVVLRAARDNGMLVLSVSDDGHGGAAPGAGTGLTGLEDRVAALGGNLDLRSDDAGTWLMAVFPCE
ncbi:MAG: sensor histidine kinase [Solirubrobacterales bacterium]